jgi:hypothetical protein
MFNPLHSVTNLRNFNMSPDRKLTTKQTQVGIDIMLAGLSFQVFSLLLFSAACIEFGFRVYASSHTPGNPYHSNPSQANSPSSLRTVELFHISLPQTPIFKAFLVGLVIATLAIFIRSCYRVAELSGGFKGALANNEVSFIILESTMVLIACLCLTFLHPGMCFQGGWRAANFKLGNQKDTERDGKGVSRNSIRTADERNFSERETEEVYLEALEPPVYAQSLQSLDSSIDDVVSVGVASLERVMKVSATSMREGQVEEQMPSIYGIPYEKTSDAFPLPSIRRGK